LGTNQSTSSAPQSQSRRASVQTEEEEAASHGKDVEVIEVGASKPDIVKESSSESKDEASEDELG
jgi:hypothetical protein